jgi:hypothetical protein
MNLARRAPPPSFLCLLSCLLCVLCALCGKSSAATPRDELLRLVPEDVGLCLVVQDLRGHARALSESPFARTLGESPLGAALKKADEFKKLSGVDALLRQHIGLDLAGVRDQLLGDAVVLAYRPNPPGKTDQDQGLLLLRARDAAVLAEFVERLNRAQKESGDLKGLEERRHQGAPYYRRLERKGENFYYVNGPVLAFTSREPFLRQVIERDRQAGAEEPPVGRALRALGADRALASLWVNPRAFDAEMAANAGRAEGAEAAVQRAFLRYWKALDGVALSLALQDDLRLTLALRARTDELPAAARRFFAEAARPSALWDRFPDDALVAAAGRLDAAALLGVLGDFLSREPREALHDALERNLGAPSGKSFLKDVLPALGPDWGLYLAAPAAEKGWFPHGVFALRVRPGPPGAAADEAVLSAVHFFAQLAVIAHNRTHKEAISLQTARLDKGEVKFLAGEGAFPPGLQPAFALRDGYLVLGSSPDAVRRFTAGRPAGSPRPEGEVPLLRISVRELRRFLKERQAPLTEVVAEKNGLSKEDAGRRLDGLLAALDLIDRVELTQRAEGGRVAFSLGVRTVQPLK